MQEPCLGNKDHQGVMEGGSRASDTQPDTHPPVPVRRDTAVEHQPLHFRDKGAGSEAEIFLGGQHCPLVLPSQPQCCFISYASGQTQAGGPGPLTWATGVATGETKARLTPSSLFCLQAFVEALAAPRVPNPSVHPVADPARFISNHLMRFIGYFSSPPTVRLRPEAEPDFVGRLEVSGHRLDQKQKLCQLAPPSLAWRASMVCTP